MNAHAKPGYVEVELHSTAPESVDATRATLKALPGGGAGLIEIGGKFFVEDGFPAFACEHQGYVKRVIRRHDTQAAIGKAGT